MREKHLFLCNNCGVAHQCIETGSEKRSFRLNEEEIRSPIVMIRGDARVYFRDNRSSNFSFICVDGIYCDWDCFHQFVGERKMKYLEHFKADE